MLPRWFLPLLLLGLLLMGCSATDAPLLLGAAASPTTTATASTGGSETRPNTATATLSPTASTGGSETRPNTPSPTATATLTPSPTATQTATATPLPTATATPSPLPSPTPDPFAPYAIEALASRLYGEGAIEIGQLLEETPAFYRYSFSYPSDGLRVTGYLNLPKGQGPFPVILLNHGYYFIDQYRQGDGTRPAADLLAQNGYLTLASDYRNYAGSAPGPNPFRFGYVVDVMNLLAALPTLPEGWADPSRVGLWGHSMGGGISVNVAVLAGEAVDAVVVYGGMSGDMADNARHVQRMWQRDEFNIPLREWGGPDQHPEAYARMSALHYLGWTQAAFSIHHGTHDEQVPYPWSEKLRDSAAAAGLSVEHYSYAHAPHSFRGADWTLFMERTLAFFDREVRVP